MPSLTDLADQLWALRPQAAVFEVGITGGVACGKSTLATALAEAFRKRPGCARVEHVGTDGFLKPNHALEALGLLNRKGFPETYDRAAMDDALRRIRRAPASFPAYSHLTYDIDPALERTIDPPDVLIIEGLGLDRASPVDVLVYLDAEEADQEAWFVSRFLHFWQAGREDGTSFYARFRDMNEAAVTELAAMVWTSINRPNLREFIAPVREGADVVVLKGHGHELVSIRVSARSAAAR